MGLQQVADGGDDLTRAHGEESRIRILREQVTPAEMSRGQDPVRSGRRAPALGRGWAEEDDRGPAERAGEMGGTRVGRDDEIGIGDDRRVLEQGGPARDDLNTARLDSELLDDLLSAPPLGVTPRQDHPHAPLRQMLGDAREALDRPVAAPVSGTDVDDRAAGARPEAGDVAGGPWKSDVQRIRLDAVPGEQAHPALPLVDVLDPVGSVPAGGREPHPLPWIEVIEQGVALRAPAVKIDGYVDALDFEWGLEAVGRVDVDRRIDEVDQRRQPLGAGEDEPMLRATAAQTAQSGHGDEKVAELEGPQGHDDGSAHPCLPHAVFFDRDNTLIVDVPYNGNPDRVVPVDGAARAVARLRRLGIPLGVITNQSGISLGHITADQAAAVNARVERLLGPFDIWRVCPHGEEDGCPCRKPRPGMLLSAAAALGVDPRRTVYIGDIGADMAAAEAAGARGILVPTPITRDEEIEAAETVCESLDAAIRLIVSGGGR